MADLLFEVLSGIAGFLASVLPDSPFAGIGESLAGFATGLRWLNWLVPFGEFGVVLALWLGAVLVYDGFMLFRREVLGGRLASAVSGVVSSVSGG